MLHQSAAHVVGTNPVRAATHAAPAQSAYRRGGVGEGTVALQSRQGTAQPAQSQAGPAHVSGPAVTAVPASRAAAAGSSRRWSGRIRVPARCRQCRETADAARPQPRTRRAARNTARIAAASASVTTNITGAWGRAVWSATAAFFVPARRIMLALQPNEAGLPILPIEPSRPPETIPSAGRAAFSPPLSTRSAAPGNGPQSHTTIRCKTLRRNAVLA